MYRKLKATWTYEAAQDLRAFGNLKAEADLANILAQEINKEIDEEILRDLIGNKSNKSNKSKKKKRSFRSITDEWSPSALS